MKRREFLKRAGAAVTMAALAPATLSGSVNRRKPNIIFILADDLGYGDLGCFGQKVIKTPNLDRIAAEGMRFTNFYAGSTVCAPSRCCLMTGYHTGHARIRGNKSIPLQPEDVTVAELLKDAGYRTALIGKWGLGEEGTTGIPNRQGFDYFFGYLNQVHAHNYYPEFLWRNQEKVALENEVVRPEKGYARNLGGAAKLRKQYSHNLFTEEALKFIDGCKDEPFFLYLAYTIPHANNEAHLLNRHGMEVPSYGIYESEDWPEPQKGMAAMVTLMDQHIGWIVEKLKKNGVDRDTLIIFSSDNGPHKEGKNDPEFFDSNGPLRGIKRDLYEGGIRVPTIAWWPGKIKSGQTCDEPIAFWDFLPTAAEIAGVDPPKRIDGRSFLPILMGNKTRLHDHLYWEFYERGYHQAVRMGRWKGVRHGVDGDIELYDLQTDLSEENNIAGEHPDIVAKIAAIMESEHVDSPDFPVPRVDQ